MGTAAQLTTALFVLPLLLRQDGFPMGREKMPVLPSSALVQFLDVRLLRHQSFCSCYFGVMTGLADVFVGIKVKARSV